MTVAGGTGAAQVFGVVHAHAGRALHQRFDNQSADRSAVFGEQGIECVGGADSDIACAFAGFGQRCIRRRCSQRCEQQRRVGFTI